ncbi:MAG TPA: acylphosphatase [Thermomicrobiales bacterium]|nr:acylphosphatase [Thermomicrobiales bacterium]
MKQRLRIRVFGRVQGVFFRASTRREAHHLGLAGFARNEPDGSVLIEAEGDAEALARLVEWCQDGPPAAEVSRVETEPLPFAGEQGFTTG